MAKAQQALGEIRAFAQNGRAVRVQSYTLSRWATATGIPEITALANKNRAVTVQPYTFERWLAQGK